MIVLQPGLEESWTALRNALAADIFTAAHFTLTAENTDQAPDTLKRLVQLGTPAVSLSAAGPELQGALQDLRTTADILQLSLVWDLPVPYSKLNPVSLEVLEAKTVEGAGRAWIYVEPDGDVLPAQGDNRVMGNFLRDPWEAIWSNASSKTGP
jgi:MoaA/NifB/PqqE/SkfB family radical SAM enzyme